MVSKCHILAGFCQNDTFCVNMSDHALDLDKVTHLVGAKTCMHYAPNNYAISDPKMTTIIDTKYGGKIGPPKCHF